MIVIVHETIAVDEDVKTVMVVFQDFKKFLLILIVEEDFTFFVASACYMV